jgi:hypothetical protein
MRIMSSRLAEYLSGKYVAHGAFERVPPPQNKEILNPIPTYILSHLL